MSCVRTFDWTPERTAEMRRMLDQGMTEPKIAAHFGITKGVVNSHRRRMGWQSAQQDEFDRLAACKAREEDRQAWLEGDRRLVNAVIREAHRMGLIERRAA